MREVGREKGGVRGSEEERNESVVEISYKTFNSHQYSHFICKYN